MVKPRLAGWRAGAHVTGKIRIKIKIKIRNKMRSKSTIKTQSAGVGLS